MIRTWHFFLALGVFGGCTNDGAPPLPKEDVGEQASTERGLGESVGSSSSELHGLFAKLGGPVGEFHGKGVFQSNCTATLVGRNVVLTSSDCIHRADESVEGTFDEEFEFGLRTAREVVTFRAEAFATYRTAALALVRIAGFVPPSLAVPQILQEDPILPGKVLELYGYDCEKPATPLRSKITYAPNLRLPRVCGWDLGGPLIDKHGIVAIVGYRDAFEWLSPPLVRGLRAKIAAWEALDFAPRACPEGVSEETVCHSPQDVAQCFHGVLDYRHCTLGCEQFSDTKFGCVGGVEIR